MWPHTLSDFLRELRAVSPFLGVLALAGGLVLMLYGLTVFRLVVCLNFAVLGANAGYLLAATLGEAWAWLTAAIVAILAGAACWRVMNIAVAVLAGLAGAAWAATLVGAFGGGTVAVVLGAVIGFGILAALAAILFKQVVIVITSLQGGVLAMIGFVILLHYAPAVYAQLGPVLSSSWFWLLAVLAPTVVGTCYQLADLHRHQSAQA